MKMLRCGLCLAVLAGCAGASGGDTATMPTFLSGRLNAFFCNGGEDGCAVYNYEKMSKEKKAEIFKDLAGKNAKMRKMLGGLRYKLTRSGIKGVVARAGWDAAKGRVWEDTLKRSKGSAVTLQTALTCPTFVCQNGLPLFLPAVKEVILSLAGKFGGQGVVAPIANGLVNGTLSLYREFAGDPSAMSACRELVEQKMFEKDGEIDPKLKKQAYGKLQELFSSFQLFEKDSLCKKIGEFAKWTPGEVKFDAGCYLPSVKTHVVDGEKVKLNADKKLASITTTVGGKEVVEHIKIDGATVVLSPDGKTLTVTTPALYILGGLKHVVESEKKDGNEVHHLVATEDGKCYPGDFAAEYAQARAADHCGILLPENVSCPPHIAEFVDAAGAKVTANVGAIGETKKGFLEAQKTAEKEMKAAEEQAKAVQETKPEAREEAAEEEELGF